MDDLPEGDFRARLIKVLSICFFSNSSCYSGRVIPITQQSHQFIMTREIDKL